MTGPASLRRRLAALAGAATLAGLAACGGGGGGNDGPSAASCGETARKQWVLDVAREWYLFQDTLPATVSPGAYATAEQLLDALTAAARAQGKDRYFSYLTTRAEEAALIGAGEFVGFGFRNRTDDGNRPFVLDVFEASPAAEQGLQRGDEIVAVDEGSGFVPVAETLVGGRTISDLLGPAEAGVRRGLRLSRDGALREVYMTKRTVTIDPVPAFGVDVFDLNGVPSVGYLHLRSYISPADPQLLEAFAAFAGLKYFIIDLRYNGGGLVSTAELVNNLLGAALSGDVQYRVIFNASKNTQDSTVRFVPGMQSVDPVRIAFLTTEATASASEININSMQPWVEAALVGSDTYGKPVGQLAFDLGGCQDRLRLVSFKTVNALGQGDYYDGLAASFGATCAADDTLDAPLGSPDDNLVRTALGWLGGHEATTCTPMTAATGAQAKPSAERTTRFPRPLQPSPAEHWLPGVN
jgi:C-terminal processing protease CtpA/Prc